VHKYKTRWSHSTKDNNYTRHAQHNYVEKKRYLLEKENNFKKLNEDLKRKRNLRQCNCI